MAEKTIELNFLAVEEVCLPEFARNVREVKAAIEGGETFWVASELKNTSFLIGREDLQHKMVVISTGAAMSYPIFEMLSGQWALGPRSGGQPPIPGKWVSYINDRNAIDPASFNYWLKETFKPQCLGSKEMKTEHYNAWRLDLLAKSGNTLLVAVQERTPSITVSLSNGAFSTNVRHLLHLPAGNQTWGVSETLALLKETYPHSQIARVNKR